MPCSERNTAGVWKYAEGLTKPYKYAALLASMKAIIAEDEFNKIYGKRRMFEKLQLDYDCPYCYNTVAKVMRENGLMQKRNNPKDLTEADKDAQKSDNLLGQDFTADAPNQKTVTDITEWTACDGKVYQSAVFDCFDNTCLGLSLSDNMRAELCAETLLHVLLEQPAHLLCHRRRSPCGQARRLLRKDGG